MTQWRRKEAMGALTDLLRFLDEGKEAFLKVPASAVCTPCVHHCAFPKESAGLRVPSFWTCLGRVERAAQLSCALTCGVRGVRAFLVEGRDALLEVFVLPMCACTWSSAVVYVNQVLGSSPVPKGQSDN